MIRFCAAVMPNGRPCGAAPRRASDYCFLHDPASAVEAAEAQRLGGLPRKREVTTAVAFDVAGVRTVDDAFRFVEIAVLDALGLDSSLARSRVLLQAAQVVEKLVEATDFEQRLTALEAVHRRPRTEPEDPLDEGELS